MKIQTLAGVALFALLPIAGCTSTDVSTAFYDVKGTTGSALDRSIRANGPMSGHAFAATQVQIVPVVMTLAEDDKGCRIKAARFKVNAHMTLPRWDGRKGASAELKQGFDMYADYAKVHEGVHVKIAEYAADVMAQEIKAIAPQPSCDRLKTKVRAKIDDIQRQHHKAQLAFDAAEDRRIRKLLAH